MKRCLRCRDEFTAQDWRCPACGWRPEAQDRLPVFAPALMQHSTGYDRTLFASLAELEAGNFWFRGRNALLIWALKKYGADVRTFMEIGCGTGFVLQGIGRSFPSLRLTGADGAAEGLAFAAGRLPQAQLLQMDVRDIPFAAEFDAIGAFDVLEHVEQDEVALGQLRDALRPGGLLMLTVPQHRWLWSRVDERACHVRRYRARELRDKVVRAGFEPLRATSFVTTLLPAMWLSRLLKRGGGGGKDDTTAELRIDPVLNRVFEWCLRAERGLIRLGLSFPVGGSRLLLARKPDVERRT